MNRAGALGVIALAVAAPVAARAQGGRWEREVRDGLERAAKTLRDRGFRNATAPALGALNTDEAASFTLTLHAGTAYTLMGICDADCTRLNLVLSNAAGNELAVDRTTTNAPIVQVTLRQPGRYRVKVVMADCHMNPCWYAVATYVTPPAP